MIRIALLLVKISKRVATVAKIIIDSKKCLEIAEHIRMSGGIPPDREDPMPYSFSPAIVHNAWWALVGINHQTTPVVGPGLKGSVNGVKLRGWDYLLQKAMYESNKNQNIFTAEWLSCATVGELRDLYYDGEEGDTIPNPDSRAELLVDMGNFLKTRGMESVHEVYREAGGYIYRSDGKGIAQVITGAKAYQDPVQKKTYYFLAILKNQGLWQYQDILNLSAPVNYHEQRGHFRLGTVKIIDTELERKIRAKENIGDEEDIEIRFAVRRAIEFIAQLLDTAPSSVHYYFWNHFRNCCSRNAPHCLGCDTACTLPPRYQTAGERRCLFSPVCPSAGLSVSNMFIEPRIDSTIWQ